MVKHFVQSNAGVVSCMIVPEVLQKDNYKRWRIFMKHYLEAQDLWDVVVSSEMPPAHGEDRKKWNQRNALALHGIKISCGEELFDEIKEMNSAKDAWKALDDLHKQPRDNGSEYIGFRTFKREQAITLLKDIKKGVSDDVKKLFVEHHDTLYFAASEDLSATLEDRSTLLHVAIAAGQVKLAKELIAMMLKEELEIQNKRGQTALSLAACKGSRKIVECLVKKNKRLLEIPDCEKKIPLVLACVTDHKSLTLYLYSVTPNEILDPKKGDHGFFLLKECIRNHMFEIGLDLLDKFPGLTFHKSSLEPTPVILVLVEILSSLFAGNKLVLLGEGLIYRFCQWLPYNLKYDRAKARKMVSFICDQLSTLEREQLISSGAVEATFTAIKLGYLDFVKQISETNPDIVWSHTDPEHSRDMLTYAVEHRQKEIANFLYRLDPARVITGFTIYNDQNNMLHLAAKLAPSSSHNPVLQMQSEARWFQEVERIVSRFYKEQKNEDDETPLEVFSREHESLLKEAQIWVKQTVYFAAIIGTLIIGITFAAAITFPGGNNDRDGSPNFSKRASFMSFVQSDLDSLYFASLSVLFFRHIHDSSLTNEDFLTGPLWTLTCKLAFSFYLLFGSIAAMLSSCFASDMLISSSFASASVRLLRPHISTLSIRIISAVILGCPFVYFFLKHLLPLLNILFFRIFREQKIRFRPVFTFNL
ncbi:hypothetical protein SLEP1_g42701 [Rubroshorea leprosula]|uniref:PGG domain-containing protein n=1 Tax=Rubroshorea leprosula TaxID=152421 RepID=A0AAV5LAS8_9ROSI|nr:hypothetical protein SLEP1_g42701 [Rubroshorea leprosula]